MKICNIALLSVATLLASCQAEADLTPSTDTDFTVLTASAQATSKVNYDDAEGTVALTWDNNSDRKDTFTIYDAAGDRVGDFTYEGEDGAKLGDFSSTLKLNDGETYTAVIPATDAATLADRNAEAADLSNQTIASIEDLDYLNGAVKMSTTFEYTAGTKASIVFAHEVSLIKLRLTMNEGESPAKIVVADAANNSTYTVTLPAGCPESITTYIAVTPREVAEPVELSFTINDNEPKVITTSEALVAGLFHEAVISLVSESEGAAGVNFEAAAALWTKDYVNDMSIPAAGNATLAVMGENLIVSTASGQYIVNAATGESAGQASWSKELGSYGAITSDDGGNLLLFEGGSTSGEYVIYSTSSVDTAPEVLVSGINPTVGFPFGKKISVYGDITKDAIITTPMWFCMGGQAFAFTRWIVKDGVVGEAEYIKEAGGNSVVTPDVWNGNMDVCYASTDATSGLYYTVAYSANIISAINAADNNFVGSVAGTVTDTNYCLNSVDVIEYNSVKLVASYACAAFSWGMPNAYVFDVTEPTYPTTTAWTSAITRYNSAGAAGSGDVIMAANGDNLELFFIDGFDGFISCYQFPANK